MPKSALHMVFWTSQSNSWLKLVSGLDPALALLAPCSPASRMQFHAFPSLCKCRRMHVPDFPLAEDRSKGRPPTPPSMECYIWYWFCSRICFKILLNSSTVMWLASAVFVRLFLTLVRRSFNALGTFHLGQLLRKQDSPAWASLWLGGFGE